MNPHTGTILRTRLLDRVLSRMRLYDFADDLCAVAVPVRNPCRSIGHGVAAADRQRIRFDAQREVRYIELGSSLVNWIPEIEFCYAYLIDGLMNHNPFESLRDYELVLPNTFPANITALWKSQGKTDAQITQFLKYFLNLEFMPCDAAAFTVLPGNAYLQSQDGVLYTKDMHTLLKYPICRMDTVYCLPQSVDLYAAIRLVSPVNDMTDFPGSGFLSPFQSYHFSETEELYLSTADHLKVHIPARTFDRAFRQLRKDGSGSYSENYIDATVTLCAGMMIYFSGTASLCTDSADLLHLELIKSTANDLGQSLNSEAELFRPVHRFELCSGHGSAFSSFLRNIWRFIASAFPNLRMIFAVLLGLLYE